MSGGRRRHRSPGGRTVIDAVDRVGGRVRPYSPTKPCRPTSRRITAPQFHDVPRRRPVTRRRRSHSPRQRRRSGEVQVRSGWRRWFVARELAQPAPGNVCTCALPVYKFSRLRPRPGRNRGEPPRAFVSVRTGQLGRVTGRAGPVDGASGVVSPGERPASGRRPANGRPGRRPDSRRTRRRPGRSAPGRTRPRVRRRFRAPRGR